MTPLHRSDMLTAAIQEMNRVYALFMERHPSFLADGGKIHIVGHSLGSLIASDILCHHSYTKHQLNLNDTMLTGSASECPIDLADLSPAVNDGDFEAKPRRHRRVGTISTVTKIADTLRFPVDKLFLMGSPLGLFAMLKGAHFGVPLSVMKEYFRDWAAELHSRTPKNKLTVSGSASNDERKNLEQTIENELDLHLDVGGLYHIVSKSCVLKMFHPSVPPERSRCISY